LPAALFAAQPRIHPPPRAAPRGIPRYKLGSLPAPKIDRAPSGWHGVVICLPICYKPDAMRTRLSRSYRFESAHFLPKVPPGHKCANMHGHSYNIEIVIEGEIDPATGWLMDFADIDVHVAPLVKLLDHRVLNEIAGLDNPTSELLAVWLWDKLSSTLPLAEVSVQETVSSRCTYRGPQPR
jgi:6-pyruvoyltetrahydropterin/6-carboxytetrahydropterin synthase